MRQSKYLILSKINKSLCLQSESVVTFSILYVDYILLMGNDMHGLQLMKLRLLGLINGDRSKKLLDPNLYKQKS